MIRFLILLGVAGLAAAPFAQASDLTLASAPTKTHLLELYTSEGCSSCPPAEAWLSDLQKEHGLWHDFVPLAFHVDYWDRLGWKDPFASKQWTARQYAYSAAWKSSSVYTPGFVLDGQEWRRRSVPDASQESVGVLRLSLAQNGTVRAKFAPASANGEKLELHLARLGFGQNIHVKAGENSGRKLQHDFVVLGLTSGPLTDGAAELPLPAAKASTNGGRQAIAAWVTKTGQLEPIQAVGGWLP